MYALFLCARTLTSAAGHEAWVAQIALGFGILTVLGWIASILVRHPRAFVRAIAGSVVVLLVIPAVWQTWDGSETLRLRAREREAFAYLQRAELVEGPVIGFLAVYSGGFLAMRILGRSPHADAAFKELVRTGTPAGRVYGLMGASKTDPVYFRRAARGWANQSVSTFAGCSITGMSVSDILKDSGAYFAKAPDEPEVRAAEAAYDFTE